MTIYNYNYNSTNSTRVISLAGLVNSGIMLFDALLLSGFPPSSGKIITSLTRSGTTATLTCSSHGFVAGNVILISGVTNDANPTWNGAYTVLTTPTSDTLTFTVTTQTTPAVFTAPIVSRNVTSITRSGTTATLTAQSHGIANGSTIHVWGVTNDTNWNGFWVVTGTTTDTLTFTVSSQTTPASSTHVNGMTLTNVSISSLTRASTTATMTTASPHGYAIGDIIGVYGVTNDTTWNDAYVVTSVPTSTTLTFEVSGTPTTPASGTMSFRNPPVGAKASSGALTTSWTKTFSGTNQAIYKSTDVESTQWFLRVDDSNANYMTVSMLEGYTDFTTGLINRQDVYWVKSDTSSSAIRPWFIIGDSKRFYFGSSWFTGSNPNWQGNTQSLQTHLAFDSYFFGDIISLKPGDAYHCAISGSTSSALSSTYFCSISYNSFWSTNNNVVAGSFIMRSYNQLGSQTNFTRWSLSNVTASGHLNTTTFPNPSDNGTYIDYVWVFQPTTSVRGRMPGFYAPINQTQWWFTSFDKSFVKDGNTYMYIRSYSSSSAYFTGTFYLVTPTVQWS